MRGEGAAGISKPRVPLVGEILESRAKQRAQGLRSSVEVLEQRLSRSRSRSRSRWCCKAATRYPVEKGPNNLVKNATTTPPLTRFHGTELVLGARRLTTGG